MEAGRGRYRESLFPGHGMAVTASLGEKAERSGGGGRGCGDRTKADGIVDAEMLLWVEGGTIPLPLIIYNRMLGLRPDRIWGKAALACETRFWLPVVRASLGRTSSSRG